MHLADSDHANGTPEKNEVMRYRSVGGYFLLLANKGILEGQTVRANVLAFHSGQTRRVCRSTLAAEASHLAEAVEAGDWLAVLLDEVNYGEVDLKNWTEAVERRQRVCDDNLMKDASSTITDKRMAIEGALLRETIRRPGAHARWIDGLQNFADVLTKHGADKEVLKEFIKTGMLSLTQTEQNREIKLRKQTERQNRRVKQKSEEDKAATAKVAERRARVASEVRDDSESSD